MSGSAAENTGNSSEFAAYVARYGIEQRLLQRHRARLLIGLGATAVVVLYNGLHPHAANEFARRMSIAGVICTVHLALCLIALSWWSLRLRRQLLRAQPGNVRDQVWQVVTFVHRWGNALLFIAATGHGVLVLGTLLGLSVFSAHGAMLLMSLVPMLVVLIHGLIEAPTLPRLLAIHDRAAAAWTGRVTN